MDFVPVSKTGKMQYLGEALKGIVSSNKIKFPKELGEEHPFDYQEIEKLMKKYGIINAIVDKYVEFILSSGINVTSKDKRAKDIIEKWKQDVSFQSHLKPWLKEAISKGFGAMELGLSGNNISEMKVLNSNYLYINRDDTGVIENINQYIKPLQFFDNKIKDDVVVFTPDELAILQINKFNSEAYGYGIVYPLLYIIDDLLGSRKEMHKLMERKANNPFIFIGGDKDKKEFPTKSAMQSLKNKLEYLRNEHEWVISDLWKPTTLDFGNIGDKFEFIVKNDIEILYMAAQIPAFLMGEASIAEGLAKEQMKGFLYRIQSMREDIEKIIEEKIFKRILLANGIEAHVEIIWGLPSEDEKNDRLKVLNEIAKNPFISPQLKNQVEMQIAQNLDIPEEKTISPEEERKQEEEEEKLPKVPSGNEHTHYTEEVYVGKDCCNIGFSEEALEKTRNMTVQEWVGFNYQYYSEDVIKFLETYDFKLLRGFTKTEIRAGLFTSKEIEKLRESLREAMEKNMTIRELEELINKRIDVKDRYVLKNGQMVKGKDGKPKLAVRKEIRPNLIARTETVKISNEGTKLNYKKNGINKVSWVAALSERTCQVCEELNGKIYPINNTPEIPAHPDCRCTLSPVIED